MLLNAFGVQRHLCQHTRNLPQSINCGQRSANERAFGQLQVPLVAAGQGNHLHELGHRAARDGVLPSQQFRHFGLAKYTRGNCREQVGGVPLKTVWVMVIP